MTIFREDNYPADAAVDFDYMMRLAVSGGMTVRREPQKDEAAK